MIIKSLLFKHPQYPKFIFLGEQKSKCLVSYIKTRRIEKYFNKISINFQPYQIKKSYPFVYCPSFLTLADIQNYIYKHPRKLL